MGRQRVVGAWPLPAASLLSWPGLLLLLPLGVCLCRLSSVSSAQDIAADRWQPPNYLESHAIARTQRRLQHPHQAASSDKQQATTDPLQVRSPTNQPIPAQSAAVNQLQPPNVTAAGEWGAPRARAARLARRAAKEVAAPPEPAHAQVIYGTLRGQVVLECNLEPSEPDDSVSLVLWYKDKSMVPIYSIDARAAASLQEARQKPGAWLEGRASLSIQQQTGGAPRSAGSSLGADEPSQRRRCRLCALLTVEALSSEDNGLYWCRVEFQHARSRVQQTQLRITVAADKPVVRELTPPAAGRRPAYLWAGAESAPTQQPQPEGGEPATGSVVLVGPHDEGARLVLECETQGGYPEPQLSWWRDGRLIDDSYEVLGAHSGSLIVRYPGSSLSADTVDEATFLERAPLLGPAAAGEPLASAPADSTDGSPSADSAAAAAAGPQNQDVGPPPGFSSHQPRLLRNRLELVALTRADLKANYSCQAWNTKLSKPPTTFVMIDMNLRPIKVQIENERLPVLADRPLEIVCRAQGSRPAAELSWFRNGQEVEGATSGPQPQPQRETPSYAGRADPAPQSPAGEPANRPNPHHDYKPLLLASNVSLSTLALVPQPEDNGQVIKCRAKNGLLTLDDARYPGRHEGAALEDSWQLEVHHLPRVTLTLGDKLQNLSIREGMDVYFECTVQARPAVHELRWWFEGKELDTNVSAGVIISNQSLVLQRVSRHQRGRYTCSALNQVGEGHSNSVPLRIQYAPVCASSTSASTSAWSSSSNTQQPEDPFSATSQRQHKTSYGAAQLERVQVSCHVNADPLDGLTYRWALEQHDKVVSLGAGERQEPAPGQQPVGVLSYTPRNELDYGTLLCWASNSLGEQRDACRYQLVPAERPDPVRNCRLLSASDVQLSVVCDPGYDGGDQQSFQMEIYEVARGHQALVANVTGSLVKATPDDSTDDLDLLLKQWSGPAGGPPMAADTQVASGEQRLQRQRHSQQHHHQQDLNAMAADGPQPPPRPLVLIRSGPRLAPATNYFLSIYSVNGKGLSQPVAFSASTAVDSGPVADLMEPGGVSKSRSQSDKQIGDQHLLAGSEEPNNWSSLLVVGSIGLAVFVMFVSVSFALIKYVDFRRDFLAGPRSAVASRSTTSSATTSGGGSPSSQKARVIELPGGGAGSHDLKACLAGAERDPGAAGRVKLKFHQRLYHFGRSPNTLLALKHNHLRPSNSDNYLNQQTLDDESTTAAEDEATATGFFRGPTYRTLPRNCGRLAFPMHTGLYLATPAPLDQLAGGPISAETGSARLQQHNLQVTGCSAGNFFQPHNHHQLNQLHPNLHHHHHHQQAANQLLCMPIPSMMNGHMEPLAQEPAAGACAHFLDEAGGCPVCPCGARPEVAQFALDGLCDVGPAGGGGPDQQLNLAATYSHAASSLQPHTPTMDSHQHQQRLLCHRQLQQLQACPPDLVHGSSSTLTTGSSAATQSQSQQEPGADTSLEQPAPHQQLSDGGDIRVIASNNALTRHQMNGDPSAAAHQKHTQHQLPDLEQCTIYVDRAHIIDTAGCGLPPKGAQIYQLDKQRRKARVRILNGQDSSTDQSLADHLAFYTTTNNQDLQTDV